MLDAKSFFDVMIEICQDAKLYKLAYLRAEPHSFLVSKTVDDVRNALTSGFVFNVFSNHLLCDVVVCVREEVFDVAFEDVAFIPVFAIVPAKMLCHPIKSIVRSAVCLACRIVFNIMLRKVFV